MVDTAVFPVIRFTPPYRRSLALGKSTQRPNRFSLYSLVLRWSLDFMNCRSLTTSLRVHLPPNGIGVGSIIIHVGLRFN